MLCCVALGDLAPICRRSMLRFLRISALLKFNRLLRNSASFKKSLAAFFDIAGVFLEGHNRVFTPALRFRDIAGVFLEGRADG